MATAVVPLVFIFLVGFVTGSYGLHRVTTICRHCLRKLPLTEDEEENDSCGSS